MKIYSEKFKNYEKIIQTSYDKEKRYGSHIYLDFKNGTAYLQNEKFVSKFDFGIENEDLDTFDSEGCFFSIQEFIALTRNYDILELDNNLKFKNKDDVFKIPYFVEKCDWNIEDDIDMTNAHTVNINSNIMRKIITALKFKGDNDEMENYDIIKFYKKSIASGTGYYFYEGRYDNDIEINQDLALSGDIANILPMLETDNVKLTYFDDDQSIVFEISEDNFKLFSSLEIENVKLPEDIYDESWTSKFSSNKSIIVNKKSLLNVLDFISPFVSNEVNEKFYINVKDENTLSIELQGNTIGNKNIAIESVSSELVGEGFWTGRFLLYQSVGIIDSENVVIEIDTNKPAFDIYGEEDTSNHVAVLILK